MLRDRAVNAHLAKCLNSVLNVKAVVAAFNQEKALVITNLRMELFQALVLMRVVAGVDVGSGLVGVGRDTGRHSSSERSLVGCLLIIIVTVVFITDDLLLPYSC